VGWFLTDWEVAKQQFTLYDILNADETSWRVLRNGMLTITNTGADDVSCNFSCDEKACTTVKAAIRKDGTKLPLWVIAKGLTARTLNMFEEDIRVAEEVSCGKLHLAHSVSEWMDQDVVIEYLKWLSMVAQNQAQYLVWDVCPSHRSEAVKATAAKVNMHLSFVPSDLTATWQPLDYRVFGSLRARANERFNAAVSASLLRGDAGGDQLNTQKVPFFREFTLQMRLFVLPTGGEVVESSRPSFGSICFYYPRKRSHTNFSRPS